MTRTGPTSWSAIRDGRQYTITLEGTRWVVRDDQGQAVASRIYLSQARREVNR